jgi:hypothetical protein
VEREEQLRWEREWGKWAAAAAFASALLTIAVGVYIQSKIKGSADDNVDRILLIHDHKGDLLLASILQGLGTAALAPVLYYLFRATRFRREQLPNALVWLVLLAPLLGAVTSVIHQIQVNDISNQVATGPILPPKKANDHVTDLLGKSGTVAVTGIGTAAGLGIAFSFLLTSLNAMRAGLLSKFMGILGIIVGVLLVIPLQGNFPVVQVFWLGALGMLFLDRFPQGRGPAWESGEPDPWPTAADRRAALDGRTSEPDDEPEPDAAEHQHTGEPARPRQLATTHSRSKKKKRKRR